MTVLRAPKSSIAAYTLTAQTAIISSCLRSPALVASTRTHALPFNRTTVSNEYIANTAMEAIRQVSQRQVERLNWHGTGQQQQQQQQQHADHPGFSDEDLCADPRL